jgi:hypothetical protein
MWMSDRSIRENGMIDIHCILHRIVRLEESDLSASANMD